MQGEHTLARQGVDDLFLDTLLALRQALVLGRLSGRIPTTYRAAR